MTKRRLFHAWLALTASVASGASCAAFHEAAGEPPSSVGPDGAATTTTTTGDPTATGGPDGDAPVSPDGGSDAPAPTTDASGPFCKRPDVTGIAGLDTCLDFEDGAMPPGHGWSDFQGATGTIDSGFQSANGMNVMFTTTPRESRIVFSVALGADGTNQVDADIMVNKFSPPAGGGGEHVSLITVGSTVNPYVLGISNGSLTCYYVAGGTSSNAVNGAVAAITMNQWQHVTIRVAADGTKKTVTCNVGPTKMTGSADAEIVSLNDAIQVGPYTEQSASISVTFDNVVVRHQ